jgi:hypothetical protein
MRIAIKNDQVKPNKKALKRGNLILGVNNVEYGPTSLTGYYSGLDLPNNGYVIYETYLNGKIRMYKADNDNQFITIIKSFNPSVVTIGDALTFVNGNVNFFILNNNIPNIITDNLTCYLNAAIISSYAKQSSTWYDLSDNNNNGLLFNSPSYSEEVKGCIVLDGMNDYISLTNNQAFNTSEFTISIWFKIETNQTTGASIISTGNSPSNNNFELSFINNTFLRFYYSNTGNFFDLNENFELNKWYNLLITRDISNNIKTFINGYLDTSANSTINYTDTSTFKIGVNRSNNLYLSGSVASLRVYNNKAFSDTEVLENFIATELVSLFILSNGLWDDTKFWVDTSIWVD